jgi:hypothetical protein
MPVGLHAFSNPRERPAFFATTSYATPVQRGIPLAIHGVEEREMNANPITGHSLRWKFNDGPMAGKAFDHTFSRNGNVSFREVGSDPNAKAGNAQLYHVASVGQDVHTVSYLGANGYTLTVVLDYKTLKLVAFASNEQTLIMQQGTFELLGSAPR